MASVPRLAAGLEFGIAAPHRALCNSVATEWFSSSCNELPEFYLAAVGVSAKSKSTLKNHVVGEDANNGTFSIN